MSRTIATTATTPAGRSACRNAATPAATPKRQTAAIHADRIRGCAPGVRTTTSALFTGRSAIFEKRLRDHRPLDLAGALVDPRDAGIAVRALDPQLAHVPHPAVDLHRVVGDASERLGREELRHRGALRDPLATVHPRRGVIDHEARRVDLGRR